MFNKEKSNEIKKIIISKNTVFKKLDYFLLTTSFILMINYYIETLKMQQQLDYQDHVTSYINRKTELSKKKQYNSNITKLYNEGKLIVDNKEYNLRKIYVLYNSQSSNYLQLLSIENNTNLLDNQELISYNSAIKFIDTTAFINLINAKEVVINKSEIKVTKAILAKIISNWDGKIHSETSETDAIKNKNVLEREISHE